MNNMRFLALFLVVLLLSGCLDQDNKTSGKYFVKKVIDGDTVELADGSRVRYIGIDTPEVRKHRGDGWVYDPEPYAENAKKYNEMLILGQRVKLEFDKEERDKYGRLLAYVFTKDSKMVNKELLEQGYAKVLVIPPNVKYADVFKKTQERAKEARRGIWR